MVAGLLLTLTVAAVLSMIPSAAADGPPMVSITSDGGLIWDVYELTAEVTGDLQPGEVYYGIDDDDPGTKMTDAGGGVFKADIDADTLPEGPHTLYVKAVNTTGTSTVASIGVDVDRNSPFIQVTFDSATVAGDFTITAEVSDPYLNESAIYCVFDDNLEASRDNVLTRVDDHYEFTIDTTTLPDGACHIRVWAFDLWGSYNKSGGSGLVVDNTAPTIDITSEGGTHSGAYVVDATVEDLHLDSTSITATVGDDEPVPMEGGGSQWNLPIDLTRYANGELVIVVEASDLPGSSASEEITIVVDNRPDLAVNFVDWGKTKFKEGETLSVNVSVINNGIVAASDFEVAVVRDGVVLARGTITGPLEPDDFTNTLVDWVVEGKGKFDISVKVDPDDSVAEYDEDDNEYSETQTISIIKEGDGESPGPGAALVVLVLSIVAWSSRRRRS